MVPTKTRLMDRIRRRLILWLGITEDAVTKLEVLNLINNRMEYRERRIREQEARADQLLAEAERVAAQTTIATVEVMESMQFARMQWEAIKKEQESGDEGTIQVVVDQGVVFNPTDTPPL